MKTIEHPAKAEKEVKLYIYNNAESLSVYVSVYAMADAKIKVEADSKKEFKDVCMTRTDFVVEALKVLNTDRSRPQDRKSVV